MQNQPTYLIPMLQGRLQALEAFKRELLDDLLAHLQAIDFADPANWAWLGYFFPGEGGVCLGISPMQNFAKGR